MSDNTNRVNHSFIRVYGSTYSLGCCVEIRNRCSQVISFHIVGYSTSVDGNNTSRQGSTCYSHESNLFPFGQYSIVINIEYITLPLQMVIENIVMQRRSNILTIVRRIVIQHIFNWCIRIEDGDIQTFIRHECSCLCGYRRRDMKITFRLYRSIRNIEDRVCCLV